MSDLALSFDTSKIEPSSAALIDVGSRLGNVQIAATLTPIADSMAGSVSQGYASAIQGQITEALSAVSANLENIGVNLTVAKHNIENLDSGATAAIQSSTP